MSPNFDSRLAHKLLGVSVSFIFKIYVFVCQLSKFSNLIFDCISVPRLKPYGNTERHLTTFILIRQSSTLILQNFILVSIPVISHFFAFEFFAFHISLRRNQIIFWCFLYFFATHRSIKLNKYISNNLMISCLFCLFFSLPRIWAKKSSVG